MDSSNGSKQGTYLAHILEHVVLELQTLAGAEVGFGRARETSDEGVYKVVFQVPTKKNWPWPA